METNNAGAGYRVYSLQFTWQEVMLFRSMPWMHRGGLDGTRPEWSTSCPSHITHTKEHSDHCLEAGWALESIWIIWRKEISLDPAGIWNLDHPACSCLSIFITWFCVANLNCGSKEASPFPCASLLSFITDLTMYRIYVPPLWLTSCDTKKWQPEIKVKMVAGLIHSTRYEHKSSNVLT